MDISRKAFVAGAAVGATAVAGLKPDTSSDAAQRSPIRLHIVRQDEYDHARMMRTIAVDKPNKQVFQSATPLVLAGIASLYLHMQNSMNAFEFSYGLGPGSLATLAVLTGKSTALALNDAMWTRYGLGAAFGLAATNVYYRASSLKETSSPDDPDGIYQDWSAEAVLHRGGAFMVCHNALTAQAELLGPKLGAKPDDMLADLVRNVLPGFQVVPAGVAATQLALQNGWYPYPLI